MMLMVVLCFLVLVGEAPTSATPEGPVDEHDRLDDISKVVFGYTVVQMQSPGADHDEVLSGYNVWQQQYMRTLEWMAIDTNSDWQVHVRAFYEMVLQWLEDLARREKSRGRVKKEMTHEWKKMDDNVKKNMMWRFIGFQLINDMANA